VSDESRLRIENPATGAYVAEVQVATPADVEDAVARARRAQPAWAALSVRARSRLLRRFAARLVRDPDLPLAIMSETGKPRYEAEGIEVIYTAELTRFLTSRAARRALADSVRRPFFFPNKRSRVVLKPHGVVAVIGPWNWPLLNNFADCVAPLLCGNAVVLKPSEVTPLTSLHVARLWAEEDLPADVLQVLPGGPAVGEELVGRADMIFFTGSQAVGRRIAARAGERLVPCVLELGGVSPLVVLRDADLAAAARQAVWSAFANAGQACVRAERVIVEEPAADELVRLMAGEIGRLRQGPEPDPAAPAAAVDVGAVIFPPQLERLERHVADAVARGARLVAGGERRRDLPGRFFAPTLIDGVTADMAIAREETMGPVIPVMRARDAEHAVALANGVGQGLGGAVFSRDVERARELARKLETGNVCLNDSLVHYFCVESPLGGWVGSGLGVRHGVEGLRQFCRAETIVEDAPLLGLLSPLVGRYVTSFPYRTGTLAWLRRLARALYRG
jgi:acyl-CoA reductase-like NAD-dependent aldehyde dehydrogenase